MKITYQETYNKYEKYKNADLLNNFMLRSDKVMVLELKIGKDYDCDYITMYCASGTWRSSIKKLGLEDKLEVHQNKSANILYIVKKGSDSNENENSYTHIGLIPDPYTNGCDKWGGK